MGPNQGLRARREHAGLTQAQLADRAGVTRQLIATAELGRHVPAVDAALKIARALGVSVEDVFGDPVIVPIGILGPLVEGTTVVVTHVGAVAVAHPVALTAAGASPARGDGVIREGIVELFAGATAEGFVLVGCDPAIELAGTALGAPGPRRLISVPASSGAARDALRSGRCHAAIVHGAGGEMPTPPVPVTRWRFARWRAGEAPRAGVALERVRRIQTQDVELWIVADHRAHPGALALCELVDGLQRPVGSEPARFPSEIGRGEAVGG